MNRLISSVAALEYERRLAKIEENRRPAPWPLEASSNEYERRLAGLVAGGAHLESAPTPDGKNSNKIPAETIDAGIQASYIVTAPESGLNRESRGGFVSNENNESRAIFAQINTDFLKAAQEGVESGLTAGAVDAAVDGLCKAFPEASFISMAAQTGIGRAILSAAVPYGMAVVCDFFPGIVPGDPKFMRGLAMAAARGQVTIRIAPLVGRMGPVIRTFFTTLASGSPAPAFAPAPAPAPAPAG